MEEKLPYLHPALLTGPLALGSAHPKYLNEYDKYLYPESNQQYNRSANQSGGEQLWNGLKSRTASILPKIGAGIGSVYGAAAAVLTDKEMDYIWTNPFVEAMNEADESLRDWSPVYKSRYYAESGLLGKMATTSMWADDFLDGAAFMASAYVPGVGISKGLSAIAPTAKGLAKALKGAAYSEKFLENTSKALEFGKLATINAYNTIAEAGAEAYQTNKEVRQILRDQHPEWSEDQIREKAGEAASRTFKWNVAALALPNMVETAFFHGTGGATREMIRKSVFDNAGNTAAAKATSSLLKKAGLGMLAEGLFEENIQGAIQQYEKMYATNPTMDKSMGESVADTMLTGVAGFAKSLVGAETTKLEDDQSLAIALGAILGGGMGVVGGVRENNLRKSQLNDAVKAYEDLVKNIMPSANARFVDGVGGIYKKDGTYKTTLTEADGSSKEVNSTKYVTDTDGNLIKDDVAMSKIAMHTLRDKNNLEMSLMAAMKEDPWMDDFHKEMMLAEYAYELQSKGYSASEAETVLRRMGEIGTQEAKDLGINTAIQENMNKVKSYMDSLETSKSQFWTSSEEVTDLTFESMLYKTNHYLHAKKNALTTLRNSTTKESSLEAIDTLIEDTDTYLDQIRNQKSSIKEEYQKTVGNPTKKRLEQKSLNEKKNRTAAENERLDELTYELNEHIYNNGKYLLTNSSFDLSPSLSPYESLQLKPGEADVDAELRGSSFIAEEVAKEAIQNKDYQRAANVLFDRGVWKHTDKDQSLERNIRTGLESELENSNTVIAKARALGTALSIYEDTQDELMSYGEIDENGNFSLKDRQEALNNLSDAVTDPLVREALGMLLRDPSSPELFSDKHRDQLNREAESMITQVIKPALDKAEANNRSVKDAISKLDAYEDEENEPAKRLERRDKLLASRKLPNQVAYLEDKILDPIEKFKIRFLLSPEDLFDLEDANKSLEYLRTAKRVWEKYRTEASVDKVAEIEEMLGKIDVAIDFLTANVIPTIINNLQSWERKQIDAVNSLVGLSLVNFGISFDAFSQLEKDALRTLSIDRTQLNNLIISIIGDEAYNKAIAAIRNTEILNYSAFKVLIAHVFEQVSPEQKQQLTQLLQSQFNDIYKQLLLVINEDFPQTIQTPDKSIFDRNPNEPIIGLISGLIRKGIDPEKRLTQFLHDLDFVSLIKVLPRLALSDVEKIGLAKIYLLQNFANSTFKLLNLSTDSNLDEKLALFLASITPSPQQDIILSELSNFFSSNIQGEYSNWAIVDGLPGAGKTFGIATLLPKFLEIPPDRVISFSSNLKSSENIASAVGTQQFSLEEFLNADLSNIDLIIIDEIYTFTDDEIVLIKNKTANTKIIALGDPSQRSLQENPLFKLGISSAFRTSTLTASYRTNVGAIGSFIDNYKLQSTLVSGIYTTSNFDNQDTLNDVLGVVAAPTIDDLIDTLNVPSSRTRVVVVPNTTEAARLLSMTSSRGNKIPNGIEIRTIDEVQGLQWDEVYTYLPYELLDSKDFLNKNRDLYTAFSRAKAFLFVVDPTLKSYPPDPKISTAALDNSEQINANIQNTKDRLEAAKQLRDLLNGVKATIATPHIEKEENEDAPVIDGTQEIVEVESYPADEIDVETNIGETNDDDGIFYPTNYALNNIQFTPGQDLSIVRAEDTKGGSKRTFYYVIGTVNSQHYVLGVLGDKDFNGKHGKFFTELTKNIPDKAMNRGDIVHTSQGFTENLVGVVGKVKLAGYSKMSQVTSPAEQSSDTLIDDIIIKFYNSYFGTTNGARNYPAEVGSREVPDLSKEWVIDGKVNWSVVKDKVRIQIINKEDTSAYPDLKLAVGAPYLVIQNPAQVGGTSAKDIFIPLNAAPLSKESRTFKVLNELYNSLSVIDSIAPALSINYNSKVDFKDDSLQKIYDKFAKANFKAVSKDTLEAEPMFVSIKIIAPEVVNSLSQDQIDTIDSEMKNVVKLLYGGEYKDKLFDTEEEAILFAGDRLERVEKSGEKFVVIFKSTDSTNQNDVQRLKEWKVVSGEGRAQHELNNLARANANISRENARKINIRMVTNKFSDRKKVEKIYKAKSVLANGWFINYDAFFEHFGNKHGIVQRDLLVPGSQNKYVDGAFNILVAKLKKLKNTDGTLFFATPGKTFSDPVLADEDLGNNVNNLLLEFAVLPWNLDTLGAIADERNYENGFHKIDGFSIRTPLARSNYYKTGINDKDISNEDVREEVSKLLTTRYEGTNRTKVFISPSENVASRPSSISELLNLVKDTLPKELYKLLEEHLPNNIKISYVPGKLSSYSANKSELVLGTEVNLASESGKVVVAHELLHALVNTKLWNGLQKVSEEEVLFVQRIKAIREEFIKQHGDIKQYLQPSPSNNNPTEFDELAEFIASFSRPELWAKLEETTIFSTLSDIINALLNLLGVTSISAQKATLVSISDVYKKIAESVVGPTVVENPGTLSLPSPQVMEALEEIGFVENGEFTQTFLDLAPEAQSNLIKSLNIQDNRSYGYFEEQPLQTLGLPGMLFSSAFTTSKIKNLGLSNYASNILSTLVSNATVNFNQSILDIANLKLDQFIEYAWDYLLVPGDRAQITAILKISSRGDILQKLKQDNEFAKAFKEVFDFIKSTSSPNLKTLYEIVDGLSYDAADLYVGGRMMILSELHDKLNATDDIVQTSSEVIVNLFKSLESKKQRLLSALSVMEDATDSERTRSTIERFNKELRLVVSLLSTNTRTNKPIFIEIVNDIYPRANYTSIAEIEESLELIDEGAKSAANISEHEKKYNTNAEKTLSESVKDLLSLITYRKNDTLMFVNPSMAYIKLMDFIVDNSMEDLDELKNKLDVTLAKQLTPTSRAIYEKLRSVIVLATSDRNKTGDEIPSNTAILSGIDSNGKLYYRFVSSDRDIRGITEKELRSTDKASKKISTTKDLHLASGLGITTFNDIFKRDEAINSLRELMGAMGSMSENDLLIGTWSKSYGKIDIRYVPARAAGISFGFKQDMILTLAKYYDDNKFKELSTIFATRYPKSYNVLNQRFDQGADVAKERFKTVQAIYEFLGLGIVSDIAVSDEEVMDVIEKFKLLLLSASTGVSQKKEKTIEESDEEISGGALLDFDDFVEEYGSLLNKLSDIAEASSDFIRNPSVRTANGEKYYKYHESTFAKDVLNRLARRKDTAFFKGSGGTVIGLNAPEYLDADTYTHNIFKQGIGVLYGTFEHEALQNADIENYIPITRENKYYFFYREFMMGFLEGIKQGRAKSFYLYSYPPSDKPKYPVFKVKFLEDSGEKSGVDLAIRATLMSILDKRGVKLDIKSFNSSNKNNPARNFEILKDAERSLGKILELDNIDEFVVEIKNHFAKQAVQLTNKLVEMNFRLPKDYFYRLKQGKGKDSVSILNAINPELVVTDETGKTVWDKNIRSKVQQQNDVRTNKVENTFEALYPAVLAYYQNHYLNSYHITQLFSGDFMAYKDTEDIVKRFAGMYAPGVRGLVHPTIGMRKTYNMMIIRDIEIEGSTTGNNLKKVIFGNRQLTEQEEAEFAKFAADFKSYNIADGQGFMLPSRAAEIERGFGRAFGVGNIMKPVHFEIRKITTKKEDGTEYTAAIPIYTKYSSIVLTPELIKSFPFLERLRDKMVELEVDELLMDTAIKVGLPFPKNDLGSLSEESKTDKEGNTTFTPTAVTFDKFFELTKTSLSETITSPMIPMSNKNFRLQLNPDTDIEKEVSIFTQLMYFLNITEADEKQANAAYSAVAELIRLGIKDFENNLTPEKLRGFLVKKFTGPNSERALDLLVSGVSLQNPMIVKKAIIAIATELQNKAISVKFSNGGKWVLQSPIGIEKYKTFKNPANDNSTELAYRREILTIEDKAREIISAEVIVPKEALSTEQIIAIQKGESIFLYNEGLGFRIPSTELHSAVSLKVVGIHDLGSNTIVAPKELIAIQGSDFDVDSLFIVFREIEEQKEAERLFAKDYTTLVDLVAKSYEVRRRYEDELNPTEFNALKRYYDLLFNLSYLEKNRSRLATLEQDQEEIDFRFKKFKIDTELEGVEAIKAFTEETGYFLEKNQWKSSTSFKKAYESIQQEIALLESKEFQEYTEAFKKVKKELSDLSKEMKRARIDATKRLSSTLKPIGYNLTATTTEYNGVTTKSNKWVLDNDFGKNLKTELETLENLRDSLKEQEEFRWLIDSINKDIKFHTSVYRKYLRNVITESLLEVVSNPERYQRTLFSISMGKLEDAGKNAGNVKSKNRDLSNPLQKYEAFASLTDGKVLTGAFANAVKVFSYASKGGRYEELQQINNEIARLKKSLTNPTLLSLENPKIEAAIQKALADQNVTEEDQLVSIIASDSGVQRAVKNRIALLNKLRKQVILSLDNNKDLPFFSPDFTFHIDGTAYTGLARIDSEGNNFATVIFDGLINAAIDNLKEQLLPYIKVNSLTGSAMVGLIASGVPVDTAVKILSNEVLSPLSNGQIHRITDFFKQKDKEYAETNELVSATMDPAAVYHVFKKAYKIGEDIRTLSTFMNIIRSVPVFISEIENIEHSLINKVGAVKEINGELVLIPHYDFSLVIPNLFRNAPHVAAAFKAVRTLTKVIENNFNVHNSIVKKWASNMKMSTILDKEEQTDTALTENAAVREALSNYLLGVQTSRTLPEDDVRDEYLLSPEKKFSEEVWEDVKKLKQHVKNNKFLTYLVPFIDYQNFGAKRLSFAAGVNLNTIDIQQILLGFKELSKYDIINGEVIEVDRGLNENSKFQRDLLKFALLNYGLDFANFSFSKFISSNLIKEQDQMLLKSWEKILKSNEELDKITDHFKLSYILQNVNRLGYLPFKKDDIDVVVFNTVGDKKVTYGREVVDGQDLVYHIKANNIPGITYPEFFKQDFKRKATVYMKIKTTDTVVYYTKVGKVSEIFFTHPKLKENEVYYLSRYFNEKIIPLDYWERGEDKNNKFVISTKSPIKIGDVVWIYPNYNADRSRGKSVKIIKIEDYQKDKTVGSKYFYEEVGQTLSISVLPLPAQVVQGENISSRGSEFAKLLTNPGNNLPIEYQGKTFRNVEHAYQTWKSGTFDETAFNSSAFKPVGKLLVNKSTNFNLMVDLISLKLIKYPELVKGINERGGEAYIQNSTHNVAGDKYWESSGQNKFIEALKSAYLRVSNEIIDVTGAPTTFGLMEDLNPDGVERIENNDGTTHYEVKGVKIGTVTQDILPKFLEREIDRTRTIGEKKADYLFRGKSENETVSVNESPTPVTKQQYIKITDDIVSKAIAKGNIIDGIISSNFNSDPKIQENIQKNLDKSGFKIEEFNWLKNNIGAVLFKGGTDYYNKVWDSTNNQYVWVENPDRKDTIYSQIPVGVLTSKYKVYGTMDLVVDHGNDIYSIFDVKSGSRFDQEWTSNFLKYGNTGSELIFDNPRNNAKLQLMWYAMMFKHAKPSAKFRAIKPIHVRNKFSLTSNDYKDQIRVEGYLEMIQIFLQKEMPELHAELSKTPGIFDAATYQAKEADTLLTDRARSSTQNLKLLNLQLQDLINRQTDIENQIRENRIPRAEGEKLNLKEQIKETMEKIIAIKRDDSYTSWSEDIGHMDKLLGSGGASTNMYVQLYYSILTEQKQLLKEAKDKWTSQHNNLVKKLADSMGIKRTLGGWVGGVNSNELFNWMYTRNESGVVTGYVDENNPNLSAIQKEYLKFTLDSIEQFFVDEKSSWIDPRTNKKTSLANKIVTERLEKGKLQKLSNLDLAVGKGSPNRRNPFEYKRGFLPKVSASKNDIIDKYGYFSKQFAEYLYHRNLTDYFESTYDGWEQEAEVIPMQFLGNEEINNTQNFSLNNEHILTQFMNSYLNKQYLDEVYTYAYGTKLYLVAKEHDSHIPFTQLINYFEDSINLHILGRREDQISIGSRKIGVRTRQGFKTFNWAKFIRTVKAFFSASTMWVKPITGTANFIFASLMNIKDGIKGSIAKGLLGQNADFTLNDLRKGYGAALGMLFDEMLGRKDKNKLYQLMNKYNMFNDSYDWHTDNNALFTRKNKLFSNKLLYGFHSIPEEVVSAALFYAQLNAMKTSDGKSMYDHYTDPKLNDVNGIPVYEVEWDGFVRGKVARNNTVVQDVEDLTSLTNEEVNKIKFLYEKIHGGYKVEERVTAEYYIFGELMLQFKKYLPSMMKSVMASRGLRRTEGAYQEDSNGVLRWKPAVIEGRWRMLAGMIGNQLGYRFGKDKTGLNSIDDTYKFSNLSERQKQDLLDGAVVLAMFLSMMLMSYAGWDRDEEDATKKKWDKIMKDLVAQWWPPFMIMDVIKLATAPVSGQKATKLITAGSELMMSLLIYPFDEEQAMTTQGNLRGWKDFERLNPVTAWWHDITKWQEEDTTLFTQTRTK